MADDPDEVVDLEAFHRDLLNSVSSVRRMVVSWLPQSAELDHFKDFDDTNVNLESLRTRPERLGLGATPSSSKTSAAALANVNSAEGRMLKTLLRGNGQKRKASEEPETPQASTSATQSKHQTASNGLANAASDSEEEDSRSKSISAKGKQKADFFHNKPSKQTNGTTNGEVSTKKNKKRKQNGNLEESVGADADAVDNFVKPATASTHKKPSTSAPISPAKSGKVVPVKPPYALPLTAQDDMSDGNAGEDGNEGGGEDDESIMTETTMTGTGLGSPGPDGEPKKKKRKKKKKKNKNAQLATDEAGQKSSSNTGMLFGSSILD